MLFLVHVNFRPATTKKAVLASVKKKKNKSKKFLWTVLRWRIVFLFSNLSAYSPRTADRSVQELYPLLLMIVHVSRVWCLRTLRHWYRLWIRLARDCFFCTANFLLAFVKAGSYCGPLQKLPCPCGFIIYWWMTVAVSSEESENRDVLLRTSFFQTGLMIFSTDEGEMWRPFPIFPWEKMFLNNSVTFLFFFFPTQ